MGKTRRAAALLSDRRFVDLVQICNTVSGAVTLFWPIVTSAATRRRVSVERRS